MGQKVNPLGFRLGVSQEHASHWFAKKNQYSQLVVEDHLLRKAIHENFPNAGIASIHIERQVDDIQIDVSAARPRQLLGSFNKDRNSYMGIQDLRDQLSKILTLYRINSPLGLHLSNISKKGSTPPETDLGRNQTSSNLKGNSANVNNSSSENELQSNSSSLSDALRPANISIYLTKVAEPDASAACLAEFIVEELEKRVPFRRALKQAVQRAERASVKGIKVQVSGRLNGAEIARSERIHKGQVPLHTLRAKMQYSSRTARTIYGLLGVKVWVFDGFANE